jgi:CheY-like chemotaxis protein
MVRQKRVLILDAGDRAAPALRPLVEENGAIVECVADQDTAIVLLPHFWPDLIVIEANPDVTSGLDFCEYVRTDPDLDAVQVVVLHSGAAPQSVDHGMALGADAYLAAPVSSQDVAALLHELLYDPLESDAYLA